MATINLTLQGKGGVGKSWVASLLAQYYRHRGLTPVCLDTDPVSRSFSAFKAFGAEAIGPGARADEISPRSFDPLMERLLAASERMAQAPSCL